MQSKVVSEQFKGWCPDGFTREALNVGDVRDFGDSTSGLMQAGFIEPADDEPMVVVKPVKVEVVPAVETEKVEEPAVIEHVQEPVKPAAAFKPKKHK